MVFNFRKISAIATSAVMLLSTAGIAAAAQYPAPFVTGSGADVAVIVAVKNGQHRRRNYNKLRWWRLLLN